MMPMASIKDASIKLKISELKPVEHSIVAARQTLFKKQSTMKLADKVEFKQPIEFKMIKKST
jgi:hypothetical protein